MGAEISGPSSRGSTGGHGGNRDRSVPLLPPLPPARSQGASLAALLRVPPQASITDGAYDGLWHGLIEAEGLDHSSRAATPPERIASVVPRPVGRSEERRV